MTKPRPEKKDKGKTPYRISGSLQEMNLQFYEGYDENFLFNKAATLMHIITEGDEAKRRIDAQMLDMGGRPLSDKYFEALRAELFFTALHQFEGFFALLIALFKPLPHWVYLTAYRPGDIPKAVGKFLEGDIKGLTGGVLDDEREFVSNAVYGGSMPIDADQAARWNDNLDNVSWLIKRMGQFYLDNAKAYNSYKHGLRVMTGHTYFGLAPENADGSPKGPMRVLYASDDSLQYLTFEQERESDTGPEVPVTEVTKHFSPDESFFYSAKMQQMLETIKTRRLAVLRHDEGSFTLNTFFGLDRDEVIRMSVSTVWSNTPMSDEEARRYELFRSALAERHAEAPANSTGDTTN